MRKALVLIVLLSTFILGLVLVSADEPEPGSPEDNACNTGGALEGRCDTDWHWVCGWYLAHWQAAGGWNNNAFFPDWCDPASLLPPRPANVPAAVAVCYANRNHSFLYSGISGTQIASYSSSTDCTGTPNGGGQYAIEAPDSSTADAICATLVTYPYVWSPASSGYNSPANLWICVDD